MEPAASSAAADGGSLIAQFETAEGERSGPQLDVPFNTTSKQLQLIVNQLLENEEAVPYAFYVGDGEVTTTIGEALGEQASTEVAIKIVYVPQAIFRVRAVTRCSSTLPGHAEAILSSSFSPDGKTLATGAGDAHVRLWDVHTEMPRSCLKAHRGWVLCIAWSPCGRYLVSGGKDGLVALWSPSSTDPIKTIAAHKKWVNALAWEPLHSGGESCRFASASKDGTVRLWDRVTGKAAGTLSGHSNSVASIKWGGDGLLYSGSHDRTVKVWAADGGKLVRSLEGHGHWVNCLALSTESAMRAGGYDHTGKAPAGPEEAKAAARKKYDEAKGSGHELLASGSDDFSLFLWSPHTSKKPIARLTGHVQLVNNAAFSPDGQWLASGSFDGSVRLWHGKTGKFVATLRGHVGAVYQLAWAADSRLLASGSKDSTVKVRARARPPYLKSQARKPLTMRAVRPLPHDQVWEMRTKKLLEDLPGHADEVYTVDWSPDGERVASGGKDRNLKMWRR